MTRQALRRTCLVAALLLPAIAILCASRPADAQFRMEMQWKCSKCGGNMGNGVRPPARCPHCDVRIINGGPAFEPAAQPNSKPSKSTEVASDASGMNRSAIVTLAGLVVAGFVIFIMKSQF